MLYITPFYIGEIPSDPNLKEVQRFFNDISVQGRFTVNLE